VSDATTRRLGRLRERLVTEHLDALLVTGLPNVRYLTRFSGSNAIVVLTASETVLLTDFRYKTQARNECPPAVRIRIEAASLWTGVWQTLAELGAQTAGFETAHLTHRDFQRLLEQGDRFHWRATSDLVESLRVCKDPGEVALIRAAGRVAAAALERTVACVRAGLTELAVCGILERHLREAGSEAHPFPPIVAAGPRSALPHARASSEPILTGDFLLLDFGATVGGYCSDVTRTFVVGTASERQREVYEVGRAAQGLAVAGVRAGMSGKEGDAIARGWIEAQGFGEAFGHGLGHGIGLEVHEAPRLSRMAEDSLPEGSVVTIEPGVYVPEWGGVRIEDDVLVTATGAELLTEFSRDFTTLGS
jgi:Xaa-Pro aminopeptidase